MPSVEMVIVAATYPDPAAAEAARARLAMAGIVSHVLPKVPGWLGRALGRRERFHLGVDPERVEEAKSLLS